MVKRACAAHPATRIKAKLSMLPIGVICFRDSGKGNWRIHDIRRDQEKSVYFAL